MHKGINRTQEEKLAAALKMIEAWNKKHTDRFIENKLFLERYEQERLRKRKWNTILVEQETIE